VFVRAAVSKYCKLGGLKAEVHQLTALEAGSPRSGCQQGWFSLRTLGENLAYARPCFLGFAAVFGILWHVKESPGSAFILA
jgi:hypothetical protein